MAFLKKSIGLVIKNTVMLKFVLDHFKTKKICKNTVNKLPFVKMYVPNQYKTKGMSDKVILENCGNLVLKLLLIIVVKLFYLIKICS